MFTKGLRNRVHNSLTSHFWKYFSSPANPLKVLKSRGMLNFVSNEKLLEKESLIGQKRPSVYIGFDPTAKSLHIGNLLSLMALLHFQRGGFKPIIILGGATGLIGDPSGRSTERQQLDREVVEENIRSFQIDKLLHNILSDPAAQEYFGGHEAPKKSAEELVEDVEMINNIDIYQDMSIIEFIRDIGIHFRMSSMLSRESVSKRLSSTDGMTFTEFSYQLFQGYDFSYLHNKYNCNFQLGGSDQWGNIASGIEYIRKTTGKEAFGVTVNLLLDSNGEKLGKSAGNGLMLNPQINSPYNFYQSFINLPDDSLEMMFKYLTFLPLEEIEKIMAEHKKKAYEIIPGTEDKVQDERYGHRILAKTITTMIHGKEALKAIESTDALFDPALKDVRSWDAERIESHFSVVNKIQIAQSSLDTVSALIANWGKTKSEGKRLIKQGGVSINSKKVNKDRQLNLEEDILIGSDGSITNKYVLVKIGKKDVKLIQVV